MPRARRAHLTPEQRAERIRENIVRIREMVGNSTDEDDLHHALASMGLHWHSQMWHDTAKEFRRQWRSGELRLRKGRFEPLPIGRSPVGHACVYCGAPAAELDHVWPRSRGGDDHPNNLVWACRSCNGRKSNKSILTAACPGCRADREPSDVDTSTGLAFYACRCGQSWSFRWDFQRPRLRAA